VGRPQPLSHKRGSVRRGEDDSLVPQNFIECDHEQAFLMPLSLREWLPEDHLAWFVIEAVEEMDRDEFYADYREDGHGRAAYEPSMMVALLLYAYATRQRSSRAIERHCRQDIAYVVRRVEPGALVARGERLKHALDLLPGRRAADQAVLGDPLLDLERRAVLAAVDVQARSAEILLCSAGTSARAFTLSSLARHLPRPGKEGGAPCHRPIPSSAKQR
jgi:hypothetical protein